MSRTATLWGYAVLIVAAAGFQARGLLLHRTATFGQALRTLTRLPAARPFVLAAWLWLGWHTFVRGSFG
jgi:Family of unknown function (DUF6186)